MDAKALGSGMWEIVDAKNLSTIPHLFGNLAQPVIIEGSQRVCDLPSLSNVGGQVNVRAEEIAQNARMIVASRNSYQKHAKNPLEAAEGDLLGEVLLALDALSRRFQRMEDRYFKLAVPQGLTKEPECEAGEITLAKKILSQTHLSTP